MNSITISTPGRADHDIELKATDPEMKELYNFLRCVEYMLYDDGPEWLIDVFETLEEKYAW